MGDVAISVPVLRAFREQYPSVKLTVLTRPFYAPMFADIIDCQLYAVDLKGKHKGLSGLYKLYRELRALGVDKVADFHNVLRSNVLKIFFQSSFIPFVQIDKGRAEKKALTRAENKRFKPLATSFDRYADVLSRLGYPLDLQKMYFSPLPALSQEVKSLLPTHEAAQMVGIAPFAAHQGKMYDWRKMQEVISRLANERCQIYLFGGGNKEKELLDKVSYQHPYITNVAGVLPFADELALISRLDIMLAMDSGNAHLASLYGIPTVTLWGVTHPFAGFYPYGQPADYALLADRGQFPLIPTSVYGNKYPDGYEQAINTIGVGTIVAKIKSIIGDNSSVG